MTATGRVVLAALSHGAQAWSVLAAAQRIGVLLGLPVRALHVRTAGLAVPEYLADSGVPLYVRDGRASARIAAAANMPDVEALVLGTGAAPLGATARAVVTAVGKPVVLVPPGVPTAVARRVLIPLEGTPETSRAARPWVELALGAGLEVTAVHVMTTERVQVVPTGDGEFMRRHCPSGVGRVDLVTRLGCVETAVPAVAWEYGADLVVLGWCRELAPGRARLVRALLTRSPAPVALVTVPVEPVLPDEAALPGGPYRLPARGRLELAVDRGHLGLDGVT